jgi:hypothetical protein
MDPGLATRPPPEMTVRQAREIYFRENGFSLAMYTEPSFDVPIGPISVRLPNPPARQRTVGAHDLHHVLTGYGTDWFGEIEVSAWEVRAGLARNPVAWMICIPFNLLGLIVCPRRLFRARRAGKGARSLLGADVDRNALLDLTLADARQRHGIPREGVADRPARLNQRAPLPTDD